jgi:NTP pyrophosphatase (non-canonical NTP hydrolase)
MTDKELCDARIKAINDKLAQSITFRSGDAQFIGDVFAELDRARKKFPSATASTVALMEEVGELAQAMLKYSAGKWPHSRVREEAVQVAVMAMRVALEGDESLAKARYTEPGL